MKTFAADWATFSLGAALMKFGLVLLFGGEYDLEFVIASGFIFAIGAGIGQSR